jgi:transposase
VRGKYAQEFEMEAVRLVKVGQSVGVTAKILGIPKASLSNWVRASERGGLSGAGDKPVTPEQMELARLRAELARMTMERDIAKKRRRTLLMIFCNVRLDSRNERGVDDQRCVRGAGRQREWIFRSSQGYEHEQAEQGRHAANE